MKISAKTEYACIAMLELASQYGSGEPVRIRKIAERHGVPSRFLVQILLQLKGAGLVASVRGSAGGYQLLKPPDEVSLGHVMEVIEGRRTTPVRPAALRPTRLRHGSSCRPGARSGALQQKMLRGITLANLLDRVKERGEQMYNI